MSKIINVAKEQNESLETSFKKGGFELLKADSSDFLFKDNNSGKRFHLMETGRPDKWCLLCGPDIVKHPARGSVKSGDLWKLNIEDAKQYLSGKNSFNNSYQDLFKSELSKFGVDKITDLNEEQKKQLFGTLELKWTKEENSFSCPRCGCAMHECEC